MKENLISLLLFFGLFVQMYFENKIVIFQAAVSYFFLLNKPSWIWTFIFSSLSGNLISLLI